MGQVCSGEKSESRKAGAFEEVATPDHTVPSSSDLQTPLDVQQDRSLAPASAEDVTTSKEDAEKLKKLQEEQARLEMIVSTAGRGMVVVRSTRGSTGYYDQGFAAALAQHLEQTTEFPEQLEVRLRRLEQNGADGEARHDGPEERPPHY